MNTWKSIKDIWKKLTFILNRPQKRAAILVCIMTLIGAGVETLGVSIILPLAEALTDIDKLMEDAYIQVFMRFLHISKSEQLVIAIGAGTIFIYILKNLY